MNQFCKLSMKVNIVKMQFFYKIKYDLRSFKVTNNDLFDNKFDLYKDDICLVLTLTYVLMDNLLSLFLDICVVTEDNLPHCLCGDGRSIVHDQEWNTCKVNTLD